MKCNSYKTVTSIFFLIFSFICTSEAQSISGRVKDLAGKGIENATITISNFADSAVVKYSFSNQDGYFEVANLKYGTFILKVSCMGYSGNLLSNLKFDGATIKLKDIILDKKFKELKEVTIVNKAPILERKVDRLIFNVNNSIMASGSSLFEVLEVAPLLKVSDGGVSMVGKGSMAVMIDEKIVYLNGPELANYLKTLRAENVEKIEIITTPPSKYDAQGNGGLINIVLKKNQSLGLRGSLSSTYTQKTYASYNNNLALFFSSKKINSSFTFSQSDYRGITKTSNDIVAPVNGIFSNSQSFSTSSNLDGGLSLDYEINNMNNIGVIYNFSRSKDIANSNSGTRFNTNSQVDSTLNTLANIMTPVFTQTINVYHDLKIDSTGKKLSTSVNFFSNKPETKNDFISESANTNAAVQNNSYAQYKVWSIQSDLSLPYKWARIELGGKFAVYDNDASVAYYNYDEGSFRPDSTRSNVFNYTEKNLAAYYSMESDLSKKWSAKAGLRYEYTMMDGFSATLGQRNQRSYGSLFPTAYIVYKANERNVLSLNYSRRIDRPGLNVLNPFSIYSNIYSYYTGNPLLLPSYSNNFELSYLYDNTLSFTAFTQHSSNMFSSITTVQGPSVVSKVENYLSQDAIGFYASISRTLMHFWEINGAASFSYVAPKSQIKSIPTQNGTSASFNVNNSFKATNRLNFYINYNQSLPSTSGNTYMYSQSNLTMGAKLKLLNNKLILSSSYFRGTVSRYDIHFSGFVQKVNTDYDYRTLNLNVTYLFGRSKVAGNNKDISFDETKRAH